MKHTRLLEIIREEIAGALTEAGLGDQIASLQKTKDAEVKAGSTLEEGEKQSKYKQLAEKYQLDEDTIMEMASISQTKNALVRLGDATNFELVKGVEQETLDQFKKNPRNIEGRLARELEPNEYPNKQPSKKTGERTVGFGAEFSKNFKKKAGFKIEDLNTDIEIRWGEKFPGTSPFISSDFATNTSEKEAAAQVFGLEKRTPGPQADPNKPKKEKPAFTGKKGRPAGEPKSEKTATLTKGDDGFDSVDASDAGVDDEGNKIEIDTKIQTPTGDTDIESRLNSVISAKKAKLKTAKKGSPEFKKELAALTSFLQGSEISKYVKKKIVGGSNPYSISNILKDIE